MSDVIISARDLTKTYRLYSKPHYKFLDAFGLLRNYEKYSEHHALKSVNFEIRRGEKVAFIGRNGAGKSTLLKLITGVTQPSSGALAVYSKANALLQIGSTFHPEFTGRENVLSYLAHLGIVGKSAQKKLDEVIEFSELEEYIDQPVKTYSTGMGARLMFSASTVMQPDLLVVDEILSVGDAYFASKSFERIKEMCATKGTTLLLVSHDIYSVQKLCDRMIWIDQGSLILDDAPEIVARGYEDSVRLQEERRLKKKTLQILSDTNNLSTLIYIELRVANGSTLGSPVFFSQLGITNSQLVLSEIDWVDHKIPSSQGVVEEGSCWGKEECYLGIHGRWMLNHGIFNKVVACIEVPKFLVDRAIANQNLGLKVTAWCEESTALIGEIRISGLQLAIPPLKLEARKWTNENLLAHNNGGTLGIKYLENEINTTGQQGTGAVLIEGASLLDNLNHKVFKIKHGDIAKFKVDYRVVDVDLFENCDICFVIFRAGTRENICRILTRDLRLNGKSPKGSITLEVKPMILGSGFFSLSVFIAKHGYLSNEQNLFYSINPDVYLSIPDVLEFEVIGDLITTNTAFVGEGRWTISEIFEPNSNRPDNDVN